jgi:outer membrane protein TolC
VDKLLAVYENNRYTMENTKLAIETSEQNLKLITGLSAKVLARNYFAEPKGTRFEWFDAIKILEARARAVAENANAIDAAYLPQISLSDTYHRSNFDDRKVVTPTLPGLENSFLIEEQNELKLSVSMRLFDNGRMDKESEAVRYQKLALLSELDHAKREQKMNFRLAKEGLRTTKAKIRSAKSALKAAESTYRTIRKKFEAGLVDDIAYLDALAQKTLAQARYKETVYDYEVKKSIYYYYAGKDPKEFIR